MSLILPLEKYKDQDELYWPSEGRVILAQYGSGTIILYHIICDSRIDILRFSGRVHRSEQKNFQEECVYANEQDDVTQQEQNDAFFERDSPADGKAQAFKEKLSTIVRIPFTRNSILRSRKQQAQDVDNCGNDTSSQINSLLVNTETNDEFLWLETSFVRTMYRISWGTTPKEERAIAISIKTEAFDEILKIICDDSGAHSEKDDVSIEWVCDRSPTGNVSHRLVPRIGVRGKLLQRLRDEWVLNFKDVTELAEHQHRFIRKGKLKEMWTPKERAYTPVCLNISDALGLNQTDQTSDSGIECERGRPLRTMSEIFSPWDFPEMSKRSKDMILYLYGAFNPVHQGHVTAIVEAKKWLEEKSDINICHVSMAISSDTHVLEKCSKGNELCIKFEHRLKLCELACQEYPWIVVSNTSTSNQSEYGEQLRKKLNKPYATLGILMGSDRAQLSRRHTRQKRSENKVIICVGRQSMSDEEKNVLEKAKENDPNKGYNFLVVPTEINNISSTKIRNELQKIARVNVYNTIHDVNIVKRMVDKKWINEHQGEYLFQNMAHLYLPNMFSSKR